MTRSVLRSSRIRTVAVDRSRYTLVEAVEEGVQQSFGTIGANPETRRANGNGAAGTAARPAGQPQGAGLKDESHGTDTRPNFRNGLQRLNGRAVACLEVDLP